MHEVSFTGIDKNELYDHHYVIELSLLNEVSSIAVNILLILACLHWWFNGNCRDSYVKCTSFIEFTFIYANIFKRFYQIFNEFHLRCNVDLCLLHEILVICCVCMIRNWISWFVHKNEQWIFYNKQYFCGDKFEWKFWIFQYCLVFLKFIYFHVFVWIAFYLLKVFMKIN